MAERVFFYGTLMTPFNRPSRQRVDPHLEFVGRGRICAALFDLGIYAAAVPTSDAHVVGEVYEMAEPERVLRVLDEIEGYSADEPEASLYIRLKTRVVLHSGGIVDAWAYFYNAPLGRAPRIESGDYLDYLHVTPRGDRS